MKEHHAPKHPTGNKTVNHEPVGHPALQKPKSPGGLPQVHRDSNIKHGPIPGAFDKANSTSYPM